MPATVARRSAYAARRPDDGTPTVDLLRWPLLGRFLRWRHARLTLQIPLFLLAAVLVLHGLYGPDLAPKNLATLVTWVHYRGLLVLVLLAAGNFFCMACPFLLPRELARLIFRPAWNWPQRLRNKWFALVLFVLILFTYELFSLWADPVWTAGLIGAYFVGALVVDALFKHATFCKWLCPIGQFNFLASTLSPLEIRVRESAVCADCKTKDCIRGQASPASTKRERFALPLISQRGCELALFQPMKVGNLDCTFCLDCVHACPHDNIGLVSRLPGSELWSETPASGIGQPHRRKDFAALALVFTFGALLNAFAMTRPGNLVQDWIKDNLGLTHRGPILALLFVAGLVVEPALLLGVTAAVMRTATGIQQGLLFLGTRYAFSLVPLGFGIWLAHYSFHFFTGALTVIPVTQAALVDQGWPLLGEPNWNLAGMRTGAVYPLEMGFLGLGLIGSWIVSARLGRQDYPAAAWRAYLPWVILNTVLWASAVWLLTQPMEMRGSLSGG
jgi:polyferredoxin